MSTDKVSFFQPFIFLFFYLRKYGKGEGSLLKAFWFIGIGGSIIIFCLYLIAALMPFQSGLREILLLSLPLLQPIWGIYSLVAIWTCSKNATKKIWKDLARLYVIFAVIAPVFLILSYLNA